MSTLRKRVSYSTGGCSGWCCFVSLEVRHLTAQGEEGAFEFEEGAFAVEAAGVADEGAIGADDAMAGDEDGDGVAAVGESDGADGVDIAQGAGDVGVGAGGAEGDGAELGPDALLEGRAEWAEGDAGEVEGVALKVAVEAEGDVVEEGEECGWCFGRAARGERFGRV